MEVPESIRQLFAGRQVVGLTKPDDPIYYSWVFDPRDAQVHLSEDHKKERRHKDHHKSLSEKAGHHPHRVHGYAYRILGGWRITDQYHNAVDPYVGRAVLSTIVQVEGSNGSQDDQAGQPDEDAGVSDAGGSGVRPGGESGDSDSGGSDGSSTD